MRPEAALRVICTFAMLVTRILTSDRLPSRAITREGTIKGPFIQSANLNSNYAQNQAIFRANYAVLESGFPRENRNMFYIKT